MTIFQKESFFVTRPSRKVHRSHPRTSRRGTVGRRPGQCPFRCAAIASNEVVALAVVDIGDPGEAGCQALADGRLAVESSPEWIGAARGLEDGVIGEEGHDCVQVVAVERVGDRLERFDGGEPMASGAGSIKVTPEGRLPGRKVSIVN